MPHPDSPAAANVVWSVQLRRLDVTKRIQAVRDAVRLTSKYLPAELLAATGSELHEVIAGIIPGLLMALAMIATTSAMGAAAGAALGALAFGVGAAPGAVIGAGIGFDAGLVLLDYLGLAFLVGYIGKSLVGATQRAQRAVERAWDSTDQPTTQRRMVDRAARELASAVALAFRGILQGLAAYLLAKGVAAAAGRVPELAAKLRASKVGAALAEWVERNWRGLLENPRLKPDAVVEPPRTDAYAHRPGSTPPAPAATGAVKATGEQQPVVKTAAPAQTRSPKIANKVSSEMKQKILYGERVKNQNSPGGVSTEIIGGHSPRIKSRADIDVQVVKQNADGTTTVKFCQQFSDGKLSQLKKSTLAPDNWSDEQIIDATNRVADSPSLATRLSDNATLHRLTVDGVMWEVIKDASGNVVSSFPTGGSASNVFYPTPP